MLRGLREGSGLLGEGIGFLRRERSLWALASVPVGFAFILMAVSLSLFWLQIDPLRDFVSETLPLLEARVWWHWIWVGPARALFWLLGWAAVLVALACVLIASLLGANLLSAPFLDRLSERVESIAIGEKADADRAAGSPSILTQAMRSFGAEFQRLLFLSGIGFGLTLAGFIFPGAHFVTGPALVFITIYFLPLDYSGFALDRRGASFRERRAWLKTHRSMMLGFGAIAFVACLVPGLNLLIMPSLVTAGTLLVLRHEPPLVEPAEPSLEEGN